MRRIRVLVAFAGLEVQRRLSFLCQQASPCEIKCVSQGHQALDAALEWLPEILIVGSKLVGLEGLQLCYKLRRMRQFTQTPMIMLLEGTDRDAKYQAYQAGVDDVAMLPLDELEFVYRLKIHLRRHLSNLLVQYGDFTLNPETESASFAGKDLALTPSEYAILSLLVQNPDKVFSTETLLVEALGSSPLLGNPQLVHTHIRNLRRKVEPDPHHPLYIRTSKRGYQWGTI